MGKIYYNKSLGQHFIYDRVVLGKIIGAATQTKGKHIVEIGPGIGTLTKEILATDPSLLTSIEKDQRFEKEHLSLERQYENYQFIIGDALSIPLERVYKGEKVIIIANLPYNIATRLLLNWLEESNLIQEMILMFQKEVADRICAEPRNKNYGALSVLIQIRCKLEPQFILQPEVFTPPPKILSSVLKITPLEIPKWQYKKIRLDTILRHGFAHRRKTMNTTLQGIFGGQKQLHVALESIGANPSMRIEELTPGQICALSLYDQTI
ncbi:dimethyladenosine transferase [Neorickettsia helminthoeca str. Oregon]|uniref:Ribosomal RNA small subunit methyltransferase A n=1 Tax=Neorickettsia helminthoeca str. Oregon TaxID=1286528 RepID=X5HLL3_9RICK|nr:16S rRNA (adenine(1518)-N(6)/adenine(1519)-N(6))-dimethyltransferase RsmA [Neorickettsia helminthoeca]AHX11300.1 dimethyladenosine transferase [Neorickettsia helminthoeca str. Oregon]